MNSMAAKSCSKLRCTKCDKKIVRFEDDVRWAESVDYIFVRNYNTYPEKLREGLDNAPGFSSYACQCQWISLEETKRVESDFDHIKWHCGGHWYFE